MRVLALLLALLLLSAGAKAQAGATAGQRPVPAATERAVLGDGTVELTGPWRFHVGDDLRWAAPDFDDSGWSTLDLTPPPGSANSALGTSGFIPGWTANGFPDHAGYAWYRLRVVVESSHGTLALKMPDSVDDAYEVYVNGERIGDFGRFTDRGVTAFSALPRAFPLPRTLRSGPLTIAIRMWMASATPFNSPDAGGMHGPPVLGHAGVIATQVRMDWDEITHEVGSGFLEALILLLAAVIAITLLWLDPAEPAYMWLSMVSMATLAADSVILIVNYSTWLAQLPGVLMSDVLLGPLRIGLWVLFWAYWFRIVRIRLIHAAVWPLVLLLMGSTALLRQPLYGAVIPVSAATWIYPLQLTFKLGLALLMFVVAVHGIRKQRTEGRLAVFAVLLVAVSLYQRELRLLHVRTHFNLFDFNISLGTIATIISLLLVSVMLLRRFLGAQRLREQWKAEIEQARQVQHVLIPHELPRVPGFTIASEYRPAREVGGDFFQILPCSSDGSVLVIVGDVTGKGLRAGMLVALIVGAIRTAAVHDTDPLVLLNSLNDRLCGRNEASATCMILRVTASGAVTLANAGHLPPYRNGAELELEGSLPIGVLSEPDFPVVHLELEPGDRLMLMSDGVAEAHNSEGEMFGFDRVHRILSEHASAGMLADAAERFGQEDDILVLEIVRDRIDTAPSSRIAAAAAV